MNSIDVTDLQDCLPDATDAVAQAARGALAAEGVSDAVVSLTVVDDSRMVELNRRYTGRDEPTDVLSFALSDAGEPLEAEIVVNAERAAQVAERHGAGAMGELALYVIHGVLHLLDYDDHDPARARAMHARESQLLAELGYVGLPPGDADV